MPYDLYYFYPCASQKKKKKLDWKSTEATHEFL